MNIAIGCDHSGNELKAQIILHLKSQGIECIDYGCYDTNSVDYPDIAESVCSAIVAGKHEKGILICGTGIGISISANKFNGIRAALCHDYFSAKYTRLHNDANVICLGARVTGVGVALELIDVFFNTEFEGGRHIGRLEKIKSLEAKNK